MRRWVLPSVKFLVIGTAKQVVFSLLSLSPIQEVVMEGISVFLWSHLDQLKSLVTRPAYKAGFDILGLLHAA